MAGGCDIEVRQAPMSAAEFVQHFVGKNRPLLLRGGAAGWPFREEEGKGRGKGWTRRNLLRGPGSKVHVNTSSIPYGAQYVGLPSDRVGAPAARGRQLGAGS